MIEMPLIKAPEYVDLMLPDEAITDLITAQRSADQQAQESWLKEKLKDIDDINVPPNIVKYSDEYYSYCRGANDKADEIKRKLKGD